MFITRRRAPFYLKVCRELLELFQSHRGKSQRELSSSLEALEGERTDFKIFRGLAKLLQEDAEFHPVRDIDYSSLRHWVFLRAQNDYPIVSKPDLLHKIQRHQILSEAAQKFNLPAEQMDGLLYGDLPANQILTSFKTAYTPESLLKRYNLALAQGLLYWARRIRVVLFDYYRVVFQYLKLARLIHWIRPLAPQGIEILVDGPASIFRNTQRYGIRMADFLPGLLLAGNWEMTADIAVPQGIKQFYLDSNCGLKSHYTGLPLFDSAIEENFFKKYSRKEREWTIEREGEVIDLGKTIFIPDFTFHHTDGRTASLEIVGFWTPEYLQKKIQKIELAHRKNLILAVNSQLNCGREDFKGEVLFYRTGIKISDVLQKLEKVGC
ncbi:hypothetical protein BMS3Bbin03_00641 [bacterium BMS3Bbin03]|nr:hypothetical protein BMS3Bbin03_00641 [bacterium BMS3Bbin03]